MSLDKLVFGAPAIISKTVHEGETVELVDGYGKAIENVNPLLVSIGAIDRFVEISEGSEGSEGSEEPNLNVTFSQEVEEGEYVYTAHVQGDVDYAHGLELDIHVENPQGVLTEKIQVTVYANEETPIDPADVNEFDQYDITVDFVKSEDEATWTFKFSESTTQLFEASKPVTIYGALVDVEGNFVWGDMYNPTQDMIVEFSI